MEFETGNCPGKQASGRGGLCGGGVRTSGFKREEVLFWEFANGATAGVGKV